VRGLVLLPVALVAAGAAASAGAAPPPAPSVVGPRQTTSQEPTFGFRSPGAARFVCAFDSPALHACASRYSQWLTVGAHVLRVAAVSRTGTHSRAVAVRIRVVSPSGVYTDMRVRVGDGAGVPAVESGDVWVPNTRAGTLSRVDVAGGKVVATLRLGPPVRASGYLDSAVAAGGSVWVARDFAGEIDRVDPGTNSITLRTVVEPRPGGLATGGGSVWAFHFLGDTVTRIDATTGARTTLIVPGALGTGIAYAGGALWLLTVEPSSLIKLDPESGAVLARVPVAPPSPPKHALVDTWWVAAGGGSLWLANSNYDLVTRVDASEANVVASIPVPVATPFGVAFFQGAAWAAGAGKVVRIDPATNRVTGSLALSRASAPIFTQLATGEAGLWATDYDAGLLYRIHVP
jgi:streptogramin lyase